MRRVRHGVSFMEMSTEESNGDAFAVTDLWRPSIFEISNDILAANELQRIDFDLKGGGELNAFLHGESSWFQIADLPASKLLQPQASTSCSSRPSSIDAGSQDEDEEIGSSIFIESLYDEDELRVSPAWERFNDASYRRPAVHLSVLGPDAFDAALSRMAQKNHEALQPIQRDSVLKAIASLGLGMESSLFSFNIEDSSFILRQSNLRVASLSAEIFSSLVATISECGCQFRHISELTSSMSMATQLPTMHALACAISVVTDELYCMLLQDAHNCKSLLVLQEILRRPKQVLRSLGKLLAAARDAASDASILSHVHDFVERSASSAPWLYLVLQQILGRTAIPWLSTISTTIGLASDMGNNRRLARALREQSEFFAKGEVELEKPSALPSFLEERDSALVLEACASLTILERFDQSNVLAHFARFKHLNPPTLVWMQQEMQLREIEIESRRYDKELHDLLHNHTVSAAGQSEIPHSQCEQIKQIDPFIVSEGDMVEELAISVLQIERLELSGARAATELTEELRRAVRKQESPLGPRLLYPLSLGLHLSISPILEVQNRHVNLACLRMLFDKFQLKQHFFAHYDYTLLGNGLFAARLSDALFSPQLSGTDQRDKYSSSGNLGLRLEERRTWPPGGPELRLALMGILNESYFGSSSSTLSDNRQLPGNLSFGIRNLSDDEIEAVMDPTSLYALDFLRLKYTATPPLDMIFTPSAVEKYDTIFKLLLRIARILAVMKQLTPNRRSGISEDPVATQFRIASSRFIEALSSYFLQSGIAAPWFDFSTQISRLEAELKDEQSELATNISTVVTLRGAHDRMLDSIMFALFLRRRQAPVMTLLEDIFGAILAFAKLQHSNGMGDDRRKVAELLKLLREKVGIFIAVCRGLSERKSYVASTGREGRMGGDSGIEQLLIRLEMNDWWTS